MMNRDAIFCPQVVRWFVPVVFGALCLSVPSHAEEPEEPFRPPIASASEEAEFAIGRFQVPDGLQVELFAAEPLLANPVAFSADEHGRFYVAETFRARDGVTDNRDHMYWLEEDLASRTVEDRFAMYRKHLGEEGLALYSAQHDRVRMIVDRDGDGRADHATVFANGFHTPVSGIGAGVLARQGKVWYTCIPHLWLLQDTDDDGQADQRTPLHYGYGVHVAYWGHDLHGLRMGPDGKLYFSIGDRGLHVETEGRTLTSLESGVVLRCNPDGSELEIFATGLRNPQELAFDQYGNLFTVDNNSDTGDDSRLVYVVEGSDNGWRIGYQYITSPVRCGPWHAEKLWHTHFEDQAAYIVPPIGHISVGPSGLTYDPGVGLPDRYREHFFVCDFRGDANRSGIHSFAVRRRGASFEMINAHQFLWAVAVTDVDFGPDSALYLTDWVQGWLKPNKGRIYRVFDPAQRNSPTVRQVQRLFAEGMEHRPLQELAGLLAHPDMRIRLEAQFALAARGPEAIPTLEQIAFDSDKQLARLHAIWGLGQIGRRAPESLEPVPSLLTDPDAEVRAQAAKVLGESRVESAFDQLVPLLGDPDERVRFFAAISLGKLGRSDAVDSVLSMLRENDDRDPFLRHAGVMALTGIGDTKLLLAAARDPSPAVRMGVLLALRRLGKPEVAQFLHDPQTRLVTEAARAINDVPIPDAMPQLASLIERPDLPEPAMRRALNANFRLGGPEHASDLARFAADPTVPLHFRVEALEALGEWPHPSGLDRIVGLWRPLPSRPAHVAADALRTRIADLLAAPAPLIQQRAVQLVGQLGLKETASHLHRLIPDQEQAAEVRAEALHSLEQIQDGKLLEAARLAAADSEPQLRIEGLRILSQLQLDEAMPLLEATLETGATQERQKALRILADISDTSADDVLSRWVDKLLVGAVPLELQLDLLEAAQQRRDPAIRQKLTLYEDARPKDDPLAPYRESLAGGDTQQGRQVFFRNKLVNCNRCHKIDGNGGDAGPDLTGIGSKKDRQYLLESIVVPNQQIAEDFESVFLYTIRGQPMYGTLKKEDDQYLWIATPDGLDLRIPKSEIEERQRGPSAMPENMAQHLSKSELRDLVEFLASLK